MVKAPKKLIEVALPLDDINNAAAREKSIRHGHPSTLHLWWARRPLVAARAILFAQLVNDPGGNRGWGKYQGQTKEDAQNERDRLFAMMRELVKWENLNNEELLKEARQEIINSWNETCELNKGEEHYSNEDFPAFHDPFAGGGAIPLEAQRLGLKTFASDLNPVAVLINKAMIEIPSKFAGLAPVGPEFSGGHTDLGSREWLGSRGLAEDVRRYGFWIRKEAEKRIGHLYPKISISADMVRECPYLKPYLGRSLTVISWIWARTVKSPNPAYSEKMVPLVSSFVLSNKKGKEVYIEPLVDGDECYYKIKYGTPPEMAKAGTKLSRGANFKCILSGTPIDHGYIKNEGVCKRIGQKLIAIVAEGDRCRLYIEPTEEMEEIALSSNPSWKPNVKFAQNSRHMTPWIYGLDSFGDLFSDRQLTTLDTFAVLVKEAIDKCRTDAVVKSGMSDDGKGLESGGTQATAYAEAVGVYLALAVSKTANRSNNLSSWMPSVQCPGHLFKRHALSMCWDFSESNILTGPSGSLESMVKNTADGLLMTCQVASQAFAVSLDAMSQDLSKNKIVSTDPPYYDNVPYADISDFFYVWLRRAIGMVFPELMATISVPKKEELVADSFRHGSNQLAEKFFMEGMSKALLKISSNSHEAYPVTIYYAFKQSNTSEVGTNSAGWKTFIEAVIFSGFNIVGTWPINTERENRTRNQESNALASSIVLVCRKRDKHAPSIPRRQFLKELKEELPDALEAMIGGKKGTSPIAPVDLAQAAIGPGMAVFSRYASILGSDGTKMSVHDALILINKVIDEYFNDAEGDMDSDTRFCVDWFMQFGFKYAEFGQADVLARAKGTNVDRLAQAGVVDSGGGKVRLLKFEEYPADWDPERDTHTPVWEALHQLIRALRSGGEVEAGTLLQKMADRSEAIRQLAYRLYTLCERNGWSDEARAYNELISSWHGTIEAAEQAHTKSQHPRQLTFDM